MTRWVARFETWQGAAWAFYLLCAWAGVDEDDRPEVVVDCGEGSSWWEADWG